MAQNAQLAAPFTSDAANWDSYHSPMEGNLPPVSAPPDGPPAPWPPYYPPAQPARRWLPVSIIVAAIILAAALIGAVILFRSPNTAAPAATAPAGSASAQPPGSATANSTCEAWPSTKAALNAIPQLPPGWDWSTPNIDTYIQNRTAAIAKALDLFEPEISPTPANTAATAKQYVAERRNEINLLRNHTYTQADAVAATADSARLDQLCGVS